MILGLPSFDDSLLWGLLYQARVVWFRVYHKVYQYKAKIKPQKKIIKDINENIHDQKNKNLRISNVARIN